MRDKQQRTYIVSLDRILRGRNGPITSEVDISIAAIDHEAAELKALKEMPGWQVDKVKPVSGKGNGGYAC